MSRAGLCFGTEREARREIVEHMMVRLREFLDGEHDFDDAVTLEEYGVAVLADGRMGGWEEEIDD